MEKIKLDKIRIEKLIHSIISDYQINLCDMTVLTECASNLFAVTPLIAAMSGAESVIAYAKDSKYGSAADNILFLNQWAEELNVGHLINATTEPPHSFASDANIVTNLSMLRPITKTLIEKLPSDSCIPLMWEPWEFREEDLELDCCNKYSIPVLGTNETNPRLEIFRYVGLTAAKLLFELNVEVFRSKIILIGSNLFAREADKVLKALEAETIIITPEKYKKLTDPTFKDEIETSDALVILDMHTDETIIGGENGIPVEWLEKQSTAIAHICGAIDDDSMKAAGVTKHPSGEVPPRHMTVTTAYMGPRAVVDLHAAGLKVGELVVNGIRAGLSVDEAKAVAVKEGIALDF